MADTSERFPKINLDDPNDPINNDTYHATREGDKSCYNLIRDRGSTRSASARRRRGDRFESRPDTAS